MEEKQEKTIYFHTIHDFFHERLLFKVLGGYYILNKSNVQYFINILMIICVCLLYAYLLVMGVYTFVMPASVGSFRVHVFQVLCIMSTAIAVPSIRFHYRSNFNEALKLLKGGFDQYRNEEPDEEHTKIKIKRVKQVRLWSLIFGVVCYFCAFSNTIQAPLMQILSPDENNPNDLVNPFLPLPIYMPFDSTTYHGYIIAFLSNALYLFLTFTSLYCFTESYLSSALQLLAQIEILNHSLSNIEKRAIFKHKMSNTLSSAPGNSNESRDPQEFQKDLYKCLKTNAQHHQTILRYFQEVKEYLGAMNTYALLVFALIFASSVVPAIKDPVGNLALSSTLIVQLTGYFQIFWLGQIIADTSADTMKSLYSTPWPYCDKQYNILLNLMCTSAKKCIILRAPLLNADWTLEKFGEMLSGAYKLVNIVLNTL